LLSTFKGSKPSRVAVVADGFKYTLSRSGEAPQEDLHRLGDESQNLAGEQPERLASLRELLRVLRGQLPPQIGPSKRQTPSDVEKARLRALGYLAEDEEIAADEERDADGSAGSGDTRTGP
jgi:hypothetical protein